MRTELRSLYFILNGLGKDWTVLRAEGKNQNLILNVTIIHQNTWNRKTNKNKQTNKTQELSTKAWSLKMDEIHFLY